jgi:carbon-monoxide dehydrogenase medium subunit
MKAAPLAYARANDVSHAIELWQQAGPDARLLAGGQSLLAGLSLRISDVPALIDISRITSMRGPVVAEFAPAFAQAAPLIAHAAIRTRGTVGGSIAYADPAAEIPACVLALDATIFVSGPQGERKIAASNFFLGLYETALEPFEIITAIEVPKITPAGRQIVTELARRSGDYAIAGLVLAGNLVDGKLNHPKVVYFGVGLAPVMAHAAMAALANGDPIDAACAALADDLDPPADLQGSSEMKRHLAQRDPYPC